MMAGVSEPPWQAEPLPAPLGLRRATGEDEGFLRQLYVGHRLAEFSAVPWSDEAKQAFLVSQHALQQHHYATYYAQAASLIVTVGDRQAGRLYLHASNTALLIVDVLLDAECRGQGIGSALLRWTQALTVRMQASVLNLHVEVHNISARRLYERLGFVAGDTQGAHLAMTWSLPPVATVS